MTDHELLHPGDEQAASDAPAFRYEWVAPGDRRAVDDAVRLVVTVSDREPFVGLPARPTPADTRRLTEKLLDGLASGQSSLLAISHHEDGVVACVALTRPPTANQRHIGELTTGAVHPDHRGRGLVSRAFGEIVRHCEEVGIELLRLDVRAGIKAERLWRYYGFEEYGRLSDYGRVGGENYAGVYLSQSVPRLRKRIFTKEVEHAQQG